MFNAVKSPYLVPFDGTFEISKAPTVPGEDAPDRRRARKKLDEATLVLGYLQRMFNAAGKYSLLVIFQGMDASGKDGTIRSVFGGINPAGCHVTSFKEPSPLERAHDFLWRSYQKLPASGQIGVFNRSHYEEVLAARVHPEFIERQNLPYPPDPETFWSDRFESINTMEKHLARSGTIILKFFLNVSHEEQKDRFLNRLSDADNHWKFNARDLEERLLWNDYQFAYEEALRHTSSPWAPWYAIPADDKSVMRLEVARTLVKTLSSLELSYAEANNEELQRMAQMKNLLEHEAELLAEMAAHEEEM